MMHPLRKLLRELHRRSLWQVVGIYLAGSWGVLQVVDYMTDFAGLPGWTPSFAFVLLLIGLPIVTATAFIQEGVPSLSGEYEDEVDPGELEGRSPEEVHRNPEAHPLHRARLFTWRNATLGGVGAATLLVAAVVAYLFMWALGVGPVGSLVAQGVLDVRDPVILADFQDRSEDASLADAVTDAFRVDLVESQVVTLVDGRMVQDVLQRMGRPSDTPLTPDVAREVAVREGIKAVVEGDVSRVGSGYLLAASIVLPEDGHTIAAFRETADGDADLLPAIDRLSQRVREKAGESLRDVRAGAPLEAVTTSSLEALRKFAEATRADERGDVEGAIDRLREAVALDPGFAMAWRLLAVVLRNRGGDHAGVVDAVTRAYEHRSQLTERERHLTEAFYHYVVTGDQDEVIRAYRAVLDRHPDDAVALNNLAVAYQDREQWADAVTLLRRAVSGPARSRSAYNNLVMSLYNTGGKEDALQVLEEWRGLYPVDFSYYRQRTSTLWGMGKHDEAMAVLDSGVVSLEDDLVGRLRLIQRGDQMALARGHLRDAERRARQGLAETEARGIGQGTFVFRTDLVDILMTEGGDTLAELRRLDRTATELFADMAPLNRAYGQVGWYWARYGRDADHAERWWDRLRAVTPEAAKSGQSFANEELSRRHWIALLRGRPREALEDLRELQRREPCSVCRLRETATAFAALQQPDSAVAYLERWVDGDDFENVVGKDTSLGEVLPELARLYEQMGRTEDAASTWRRFADHWADADAVLQPRVEAARK
ncbi:MAG: tetratricopeptide repeat protein, partial [Gemmatimonadota bacterium]